MRNKNKNKKKLVISLITVLVFSIGCLVMINQNNKVTTTAMFIKVLKKEFSEDYKDQWIIAHNSSDNRVHEIKIKIKDKMVWNLIEEEREYFIVYEGTEKTGYKLSQIGYINDKKKLS